MITALAVVSALFALIPCALFLRNVPLYRRLPMPGVRARCSVLIPARDEEANILPAVQSVLTSEGMDFEVVVLDDGSTDRTAEIVSELATIDARVRLETAPQLPPGWCGKNHACHQLAAFARHPLLVFLDADVRISRPDTLARLAQFVEESGAAFVSGVPRQETRTWLEKLIIPLIHFVLLGFLPLRRMRATTDPRFAAACGQILAVTREAYERTGGHGAVRGRIHDAVALARNFRAHGHRSDLFDATDTFHCRMYSTAAQVWNGFAKNAHEGLGSPALIGPATALLGVGQLVPFVALAFFFFGSLSAPAASCFAVAICCAWTPRVIAAVPFRQSWLSALLHPLGVALLLSIQWASLVRGWRRKGVDWKGRPYFAAHESHAS